MSLSSGLSLLVFAFSFSLNHAPGRAKQRALEISCTAFQTICRVGSLIFSSNRQTLLGPWDSRTLAAANISLVNSTPEHKLIKR
jgi:hypothetical protein